MQARDLIDAACQRTGLDDFGEDTWREGLEVLVRSTNDEAALNEMGEGVVSRPDRRLSGQPARGRGLVPAPSRDRRAGDRGAAVRARPAPHRLHRPELPAGPRPGAALAAHVGGRASRARRRRRRPSTPTRASPRRRPASTCRSEMFPGFVGMLPASATGPQECLLVLAFDFRSQVFEGMARSRPTASGCWRATWSPPTATTSGSSSCCSGAARRPGGGSRRRATCTRSPRSTASTPTPGS